MVIFIFLWTLYISKIWTPLLSSLQFVEITNLIIIIYNDRFKISTGIRKTNKQNIFTNIQKNGIYNEMIRKTKSKHPNGIYSIQWEFEEREKKMMRNRVNVIKCNFNEVCSKSDSCIYQCKPFKPTGFFFSEKIVFFISYIQTNWWTIWTVIEASS